MFLKMIKGLKRDGFLGFIKYVSSRLRLKRQAIRLLLSPIAISFSMLILAISPFIRIRFLMLFSNRIGHFCYNTELMLCALDHHRDGAKTFFYLVPGGAICNTQLLRMWKRIITILPFSYLIAEIDRYLMLFSNRYKNDPMKNYFKRGGAWDVWNFLGKTNQGYLSFTKEEERRGEALLQKLGIPPGSRFVCLLGRDARYLSLYMPQHDLTYTNYRNVSINNYQLAAKFLADGGLYVIRVGRLVEEKFNIIHPKIIDYANSDLCSDFADIYLNAKCFFMISVGSGLDEVAHIFRKPILQTNITLVDPDFSPDWHLFIPKKMKKVKEQTLLTLEEIHKAFPWHQCNGARSIPEMLQTQGLALIENTPEEILEVTQEMLLRLKEEWKETPEEEDLQQQLWDSFKDSGLRSSPASPPPELNIAKLKMPVFEGSNRNFNKHMGKVRLRMGKLFLYNNQAWLMNKKLEHFTVQEKHAGKI